VTAPRRRSVAVRIGAVTVGGGAPVVVQSMTNTDTADIEGTIAQVAALSRAGSEMVRITVDREEAAAAVPHIRDGLRKRGMHVHDMQLRLTLDRDMVVRDIEVTTNDAPYDACPSVAPNAGMMPLRPSAMLLRICAGSPPYSQSASRRFGNPLLPPASEP